MSLLEGLNPQQLEAVTLPLRQASGAPQSALVLAGAGSGKTRVLTTRIAHLIHTGQAGPHGLLAVTFTNKAAREMLTRIAAMLPINTRGMWVGTFHGLCNRLLRAHYREAGLPQLFQIMDGQDQLAFVKRLLKALNIDDEKFQPRQVARFINDAKEQALRASEVDAPDEFSRRLRDIYAAYDEQCNREGVVDFAELLLRAFELLTANRLLCEHYRGRFGHILVDEFQDTNRLQYLWLKLLAGGDNALFAVGDDDQSIYAFRGATVENMRDFERDYPGHRLIKLEQNYRSHGNILTAANAVIRHNANRLGKNLWTADGEGEPLRLHLALTDSDEASFVVEEAQALHRDGVRLSQMAVLYRSNAQSRVIEHTLFRAGVPYRVYGGLRFFERQEVKHALAYLRLLANSDDDGALLRIVNFPTRGVGSRTLEQLQEEANATGASLWSAAARRAQAKPAPPGRGVEGFVALIESMRQATDGLSLAETVEHVIEASGLAAHYRTEREGQDRLENLGELVNAASAFAEESDENDLTAFLAHASLEAGEHQAGAGDDALQLMTAHSAKGLEFHSVFITGLEEGLFPHENSFLDPGGLEEERRLMYVALTRARRRLYLSLAQSRMLHGQTRYNVASRFLQEIPVDLLKNVGGGAAPSVAREPAAPPTVHWRRGAEPTFSLPAGGEAWHVGQSVLHPKFGRGVIVNCEGRGPDARVQVRFSDAGMKWLALAYAKLVPA